MVKNIKWVHAGWLLMGLVLIVGYVAWIWFEPRLYDKKPRDIPAPTSTEVEAPTEEIPAPAPSGTPVAPKPPAKPPAKPPVEVVATSTAATSTVVYVPLASAEDQRITEVINLVNAERAKAGIAPVAENGMLDRAARAKVRDMVSKHYFAHTSPEGLDPWHWFRQSGYRFKNAGENLAQGFDSFQDMFYLNETLPDGSRRVGFMFSPDHKANILNPKYTEIGIGLQQGAYIELNGTWTESKQTLYVAQFFGSQ